MVMAFLLLAALCGKAQDNVYNRNPIASPTAAAYGKYVDCPVNQHTGTALIDQSIYTVVAGNMSVPISISYHSSGIKVLEPSSWIGANFTLNAGGIIVRTVRGAPDERNTSTIYNQDQGWYSDTGYMRKFYTGLMQDWQGVAAGRRDAEPDLYTFNFNGYTGKFFFSDDRRPIILAEGKNQDIQIDVTYSGTNSIGTFTLITPDGIQHVFGGSILGQNNVEITNPFTTQSGYLDGKVVSSWYLTRMVNVDRSQTIDFSYDSENYSYYTIVSAPVLSTDNTNPPDARLVKNYIQGKRLSRIDWPTGTMLFNAGALRTDVGGFATKDLADEANTEARTLASIDIKNNSGYCKRLNVYTSYWTDNTTALPSLLGALTINTDKKRLKLDSIKESTCSGILLQPATKFEYFTDFVPRRLTFAQDHWGYFNAQTGNTKLTPTITETNTGTVINGANREPSWPAMRGGALKRIYWPTGGNSEYIFEPHFVTTSLGAPSYLNKKILTIGYDGSNPQVKVDTSITLVGGQYKVSLLNTTGGSNATLSLKFNPTGQYFVSLSANTTNKITDSLVRGLPDGVYTLTITKDAYQNGSTSGNGATGIIDLYTGSSGPVDAMVGGLRISTTIATDHLSGNIIANQYDYSQNGHSSGILYSRPVYAALVRNDLIAQLGNWTPSGFVASCNPQGCLACTGFPYFRSANSIQPMSTSQGEHVGYETVSVANPDNGYSTYRYYTGMPIGYITPTTSVTSVDRSTCSGTIANYPYIPDEHNYLRGKLQEEMHFRSDGKILKDILYTHHYETPTDSTRALIVSQFANTYLGSFYWLTRSRKYKEVLYTTLYAEDSQDYVTNTQTINYNSVYHNLPTREVYFDSKGDSVVTSNKFVKDFQPNCAANFTCDNSYRTACNTCQATYTAAQNACAGQGGACYTNAYLNYQKCMDNARMAYSDCKLQKQHGFLSDNYYCRQFYTATADPTLKAIYEMSSNNDNERIEQSTFKAGKLVNARIHLFRRQADSVRVYPQEMQVIPIAWSSAAFASSGISGNTFSKDSRYVREASVLFDSGVVKQLASDYDAPESTIWDYRNSYRTATATNATLNQIAYTSFEGESTGGWVYTGEAETSASAPTGKKVYAPDGANVIHKYGLDSNTTYIISYWTDRSVSYSIGGTQSTQKGPTANGWTYYEHLIKGVTELGIVSSGKIDELKLYPAKAQMVTYTYEPLVGITSMSNAGDQITRYNYDALGRLIYVTDRDGNMLKVFDYQFQSPQLQ